MNCIWTISSTNFPLSYSVKLSYLYRPPSPLNKTVEISILAINLACPQTNAYTSCNPLESFVITMEIRSSQNDENDENLQRSHLRLLDIKS